MRERRLSRRNEYFRDDGFFNFNRVFNRQRMAMKSDKCKIII